MFVGGSSRVLDLKNGYKGDSCIKNNNYENDSFNLDDEILDVSDIVDPSSPGITAFKVAYGKENQSHFTSVELSQDEHKETQESLAIIEQMSKSKEGGGSSTRASKGNSMYDVYLTRSYECTVQGFGNMMIQPLSYFVLENVPMFHGTYLILDVKHSVKPNNVMTTFKGLRMTKTTVPIVKDALSLLNLSDNELSANKGVEEGGMSEYLDSDVEGFTDPSAGKTYVDKLNQTQKNNINVIIQKLKEVGITQDKAIAAVLSIVSKESNFIPINEGFNYTAKRLTEVFPSKFPTQQDTVGFVNPTTKRADQEQYQRKIANQVYGGRYGNSATNDGWDYRGRGFNQLTFKGSYEKQKSNSGVDIVSNPDLLNQTESASKVIAAFMKKGIDSLKSQGKLISYGATNANDFQDITNAVFAYYHCNTGTGKSVKSVKQKLTGSLGGMKRAQERAPFLLDYIKENGLV
jgi:putative chitinase